MSEHSVGVGEGGEGWRRRRSDDGVTKSEMGESGDVDVGGRCVGGRGEKRRKGRKGKERKREEEEEEV